MISIFARLIEIIVRASKGGIRKDGKVKKLANLLYYNPLTKGVAKPADKYFACMIVNLILQGDCFQSLFAIF
jgi:hypothetical protein